MRQSTWTSIPLLKLDSVIVPKVYTLKDDPLQSETTHLITEALKQLLIIPRTPESSPEPKEAPAPACTMEDLNEEEQREVNEYIQKRFSKKCAAPTIKHERDDSSSDSSPRKRPRKPGEKVVIDLTED